MSTQPQSIPDLIERLEDAAMGSMHWRSTQQDEVELRTARQALLDGIFAQHHRDSAELRNLCAARDEARRKRDELRAQVEALSKNAKPVYLVATGEVHEGQDTYTRHDKPVPLADQEMLFTSPSSQELTRPEVPDVLRYLVAAVDAGQSADYRALQEHRVMRNARAMLAAAPHPEAQHTNDLPTPPSETTKQEIFGELGPALPGEEFNSYLSRKVREHEEQAHLMPAPAVRRLCELAMYQIRMNALDEFGTGKAEGSFWEEILMQATARFIQEAAIEEAQLEVRNGR